MKSTLLTAALVAAYGSDQAHLSGGEAHDAARHQEECDAGIVVNCQVEEGWQWSACDETCGQGHSTRSRAVTVEACNGGADCPPLDQTKLCMDSICVCEQLICQWETSAHSCTDYSDAAGSQYYDGSEVLSSYTGLDGVATGQGAGDQHGTETSANSHDGGLAAGGAKCMAQSLRVYHGDELAQGMGHHCKIDNSGSCKCKCNSLFQGNYNPKELDLFDHTLSLDVDSPTMQPTSWPTAYPTMAAPTVQEQEVQTSMATTEMTLAGITEAEFTPAVEGAVEEAIAAQYDVHVSQVTVELVNDSSGRRLTAGLSLQVTIHAAAAKLVEVQTEMQQIADVPALKESFAEVINEFLVKESKAEVAAASITATDATNAATAAAEAATAAAATAAADASNAVAAAAATAAAEASAAADEAAAAATAALADVPAPISITVQALAAPVAACTAGWTGASCDVDEIDCTDDTCLNGGTCSEGTAGSGTTVCTYPEPLMLSGYIEGVQHNKAVTIFNNGCSEIDLSDYRIQMTMNTRPRTHSHYVDFPAGSTLASGATYMVCNNRATFKHMGFCKLQAGFVTGSINHNGDDTLTLQKNGVEIDSIGEEAYRKQGNAARPDFGYLMNHQCERTSGAAWPDGYTCHSDRTSLLARNLTPLVTGQLPSPVCE